jgi:hypothetical protein
VIRERSVTLLVGLALISSPAPFAEEKETVEQIMAKVAANQDRSQDMRTAFLYHQDLLLRFKRGNGKIAREERREYTVTPTSKGSQKDLTHFLGKYERDGKLIEYKEPGYNYKDVDIDGDLIDDLANDLANDKESRDGIAAELFPLTTQQQGKYLFALRGIEDYRGKNVYRITFQPRARNWSEDDGTPWAGEILVDTRDHQPVLISTHLARGLPVVVKTLLGTNLKGLGFKLTYERFDEGLWFPVNYSAEFEVRAVFFYKRKIAIALNNNGFKRARVETKVSFDEPLQIERVMEAPEVKIAPLPHPLP